MKYTHKKLTKQRLIELYSEGRRDFTGVDIRGVNLGSQELSEIDLSYSKLEGADFSSANLENAVFSNSSSGVTRKYYYAWISISMAVTLAMGIVVSFTGISVILPLKNEGINSVTLSVSIMLMALLVLTVLTSVLSKLSSNRKTWQKISARSMAVLGFGICIIAILFAFFQSGELPISLVVAGFLAGILSQLVSTGVSTSRTIVAVLTDSALVASVCSVLAFIGLLLPAYYFGEESWIPVAVLGMVSIGFGDYASRGAYDGDQLWAATLRVSVKAISLTSTSFKEAILTNSDFSYSNVKLANFKNANLNFVKWLNSENVNYARIDGTYLEDPRTQEILVSGKCEGKDLSDLNLDYMNLSEFNLSCADLSRSRLNHAVLDNANLNECILKQTQLDHTSLMSTNLTGSCIEDWGITRNTDLSKVECGYVYMKCRKNRAGSMELSLRKPDEEGENFREGEFATFIQPYLDTLDLYHRKTEFDPRVIAITYSLLDSSHPDDNLELLAIEKRGNHAVNIKVGTAEASDKSALSAYYRKYYNFFRSLPATEQWEVAKNMLGAGAMYEIAKREASLQSSGHLMMVENMTTNNYYGDVVSGDKVGGDKVMGDKIENQFNNSQDLAQAASDIKALLDQLSADYPDDSPMVLGAKAADRIEKDKTLKARLIRGLKSGTIEGLGAMIDHPLAKFFTVAAKEVLKD